MSSSSRNLSALQTVSLEQAQAFTSRIWTKHRSSVPEAGRFASTISRFPLGRSHVSMVDCASPIQVSLEPCPQRAFLYLPLEGSMDIHLPDCTLHALPGGPVLVGPGLACEFSATPVKCLLFEFRAARLCSELNASGDFTGTLPSLSWPPSGAGARSFTALARFLVEELMGPRDSGPSPVHLRRMESLVLSTLAGMVAGAQRDAGETEDLRMGSCSVGEVAVWLQRRLRRVVDFADLAAFTGLTLRSLQRSFLRHFHSTPAARLRELRLDAVREALLKPGGRKSVSEVALEFQFDHLGRFSAAYRRKFHEAPSVTLRLSRKSQPGGV